MLTFSCITLYDLTFMRFDKNGTVYQLRVTQKLPADLERAWDFLSDPANLKRISPDYMGFDIVSGADRHMYPGQIIEYILRPVFGLKSRWVTEITHVVEKSYFVDEQRFGPYALWHHKHFIKPIEGGVEMEDIVHYKLPLSPLSSFLHPMLVKPKLLEIFSYRRNALIDIFGEWEMEKKYDANVQLNSK